MIRSSKVASANGMFYLIKRYVYDRIGGHREAKGLRLKTLGSAREL